MIEIPKDIFADVPSKCKECNHNTTKWLKEHEKQIRDEVIEAVISKLISDYEELDNVMILDIIEGILEPMKGEQNEIN